jgi:hypothetical protein
MKWYFAPAKQQAIYGQMKEEVNGGIYIEESRINDYTIEVT